MKTTPTEEDFEEILTPEEIHEVTQAALKAARARKQGVINSLAYSKKVFAKQEEEALTSIGFYNLIISKAKKAIPGFRLTEEEKKIYMMLCQYFTNDPAFEKDGMELKKGLMIWGKIGCGKTTMMNFMQDNPRLGYAVIPCQKVTKEFIKDGVEAIEKYEHLIPFSMGSKYGHKEIGTCFDDFGTESASVNYGNKSNVMAEIFYSRYANNIPTHITTNLNPDEIERDYGPRIRSRMREMFNQIIFPGGDKRK